MQSSTLKQFHIVSKTSCSPHKTVHVKSIGIRPTRFLVGGRRIVGQASQKLESRTEQFLETLTNEQLEQEEAGTQEKQQIESLKSDLVSIKDQITKLNNEIDEQYNNMFGGRAVQVPIDMPSEQETQEFETVKIPIIDEAKFGQLGRDKPQLTKALFTTVEQSDSQAWIQFQSEIHALKLKRSRLMQESEELQQAVTAAEQMLQNKYESIGEQEEKFIGEIIRDKRPVKIVLICGFESFNLDLYGKVSRKLANRIEGLSIHVFSERDIVSQREAVKSALEGADVFFGSLIFDYDIVEWVRDLVEKIPYRLVFESAYELMGTTKVGNFEMAPGGKSRGPPPAVQKVLSLFSSQREEDRLVGYLSFLKIGPKLLKFIPGQKVKDLRDWLTVYSYWNQGGEENVTTMFLYMLENFFYPTGLTLSPLLETPATGCLHPDAPGVYFKSPSEYLQWYHRNGPLKDRQDVPTAAVLLYRKHVITGQLYVNQLIQQMEQEGVRPVPIFINGVEAHTIVRDQITTSHEQDMIKAGKQQRESLKRDAVLVDAIVNTIGFPLVGGPAGSSEGGRQVEVAKAILSDKNVPYFVAAPLLIQDLQSWSRDGIAGLQSVVLYSLPELDGAIDTVPLGGLVGNNIFLIPERVKRLSTRLKNWVNLRKKSPQDRKIAVLVYGFPPGVGAVGTAALLNVPKSLEQLMHGLSAQGYDVGQLLKKAESPQFGEAVISALKLQENQRAVAEGEKGIIRRGAGAAGKLGWQPIAKDVSTNQLRDWLTYPREWGPSEWGPMPFLPTSEILVQNMQSQWGDLRNYRGLQTTGQGNILVSGLQSGNIVVGVQPLLGVEGDPMRLLFERDFTPHPQYAAFYKWLQNEFKADAVLHFGMHGTVEWLPGAPLGNSGFSWSDVLLADMPNVYLYACNNPSESIIAKRRGYGTIVSHNVPPYGRAGLYKQMAELKALLQEYRDDPEKNVTLQGAIIKVLVEAGLDQDCPPVVDGQLLTVDSAEQIAFQQFQELAGRMYQYLQIVEGRLFSEGLHVLGTQPNPEQMEQYLGAYFNGELKEDFVKVISQEGDKGLEFIRAKLERTFQQEVDTNKLKEALKICQLLTMNTEEMNSILKALNGEYILPEAGGDLLRDGAGVLPTGRNIHALDPYRMPSAAALERGTAAAAAIIEGHRQANDGAYPETVSVNLWGLDAIKTKGESVAIALHMVGARPVKSGMGQIVRFELMSLQEMEGRPRIDVLCNMSGIFRDSFQNVVELLDDLFNRAAEADELDNQNYIRKHARAMKKQGLTATGSRLFSNPPGDYGSMVNERVGQADWESGDELGDTWASRNAFSYGRGSERGVARPEVLQELLKTTERIVQQIDSVEYGLTDIQEYYANTGALKRAAETAKGGNGVKVGCSIVESFGNKIKPRELDQVLRLEYRSKLLNPKWAEAMANQGSGGAYEISQRMTAMLGWGATVNFQEDWTWSQAAETYVMDPEMAAKLKKANPQAFGNVVRRMLEANGRGIWKADDSTIQRLKEQYTDIDDYLEGISV